MKQNKVMFGVNAYNITYNQFLDTVKVIKMLYGREVALKFFTDNIKLWYN